jgi:transposase
MPESPMFVGIDVAQAELEIALRPSAERWAVSNDEAGVATVVARLQALRPVLMVLEATGGLEVLVTSALAAAELPVVVVNPRQARDFAKATGQLAKTDALDARALAHFTEAVRPALRPLPDAQTRALSAQLTRRRQLVERLTAEKNRIVRAPGSIRPIFKPISPGWSSGWLTSIPTSAGPSAPPRSGGSTTICCKVRRGWGRCSPAPCWPICRSWAP